MKFEGCGFETRLRSGPQNISFQRGGGGGLLTKEQHSLTDPGNVCQSQRKPSHTELSYQKRMNLDLNLIMLGAAGKRQNVAATWIPDAGPFSGLAIGTGEYISVPPNRRCFFTETKETKDQTGTQSLNAGTRCVLNL